VTAFEYRKHELMCNSITEHPDGSRASAFFRAPREVEYSTPLAALRKLAVKAGWTHVRSPYGRRFDKDFCPDHKPAEAAPAAGTERES
jgi:hypothetical protein